MSLVFITWITWVRFVVISLVHTGHTTWVATAYRFSILFFFSTLDPSLTNLLQNEGAWGTGTTSNRVSITSWHTCSLGCDMTHTRTLADYMIRWCLLWNPRTLFWNSLVPPALYENQTRTSGRLRKNHNFICLNLTFNKILFVPMKIIPLWPLIWCEFQMLMGIWTRILHDIIRSVQYFEKKEHTPNKITEIWILLLFHYLI